MITKSGSVARCLGFCLLPSCLQIGLFAACSNGTTFVEQPATSVEHQSSGADADRVSQVKTGGATTIDSSASPVATATPTPVSHGVRN
jgi:hypothetical protein